ncbi:MAG: hypothetical protein ACO3EZ_14455 [Prochlorotrichaceae cyanobacterium]
MTSSSSRFEIAALAAGVLLITLGMPLFACIRDAKALRSSAPVCHPSETFEQCLPVLPPVLPELPPVV